MVNFSIIEAWLQTQDDELLYDPDGIKHTGRPSFVFIGRETDYTDTPSPTIAPLQQLVDVLLAEQQRRAVFLFEEDHHG